MFTSQSAAMFYDKLFSSLDFTLPRAATERRGFPKEAMVCAFIVMKCEGFTQITDLMDYLDNNRLIAHYAGSYLCPDCCAGRRSARLSLLSFCQTASAFRLICLFHTFFRRGVYRAMAFAPLRCPKLFRFPFACLRAVFSVRFAHLSYSKDRKNVKKGGMAHE